MTSHESPVGESIAFTGVYMRAATSLCSGRPVYVRPSKVDHPQLYLFWIPPRGHAKGAWAVTTENTCRRDGQTELIAVGDAATPDLLPVHRWLSLRSMSQNSMRLEIKCASFDAADVAHLRAGSAAAAEVKANKEVDAAWKLSAVRLVESHFFIPGIAALSILIGSCIAQARDSTEKRLGGMRRKYRSVAHEPEEENYQGN